MPTKHHRAGAAIPRSVSFILLAALLLAALGAPTPAARAADFRPICKGTTGDIATLVAGITAANGSPDADTIVLPAGCVYTLPAPDGAVAAAGLPPVEARGGPLTIVGNGATIARAAGAAPFRLFDVQPGASLALRDLTLTGGDPGPGQDGGAIRNAGALALAGVTLRANRAGSDGGAGSGGALANLGTATVERSALVDNVAGDDGGAIYSAGPLTVTSSTIARNQARGAPAAGGGILVASPSGAPALATLNGVTITANTAAGQGTGGGIASLAPQAAYAVDNAIVSGNTAAAGANCAATISAGAGNVELSAGAASCPGFRSGDPRLVLEPATQSFYTLGAGSAARGAGVPATCPARDQRGRAPLPSTCDAGAIQTPGFVVNTTADSGPGSLRQAILSANATPELDVIAFQLSGAGVQTFALAAPLPAISAPLVIDGYTQPGARPGAQPSNADGVLLVELSGAGAGGAGLAFSPGSDGSLVRGLIVNRFATGIAAAGGVTIAGNVIGTNGAGAAGLGNSGAGVEIAAPNVVVGGSEPGQGNTIAYNGGAGVRITGGSGVSVRGNRIFGNGGLGIDLGPAGVTPNDLGDQDAGPNGLQNFPVLARARSTEAGLSIEGRLNTTPGAGVSLDFYRGPSCDPAGYGQGQEPLFAISFVVGPSGNSTFQVPLPIRVPDNELITAVATGPDGSSEFAGCVAVSPGNDTWTRALRLSLVPGGSVSTGHLIDLPGQSRWYKFAVEPGVAIGVTLGNLPADYDLAVYRDIGAAYRTLASPADLNRLSAEFAPDIYSPDIYSPDIYSPDIYSPDIYSPDIYSPDIYSPDIYSPDIYSPDIYSPEAFSSAQVRSMIAIASQGGTAPRRLVVNSWNSAGDFYVRVRARSAGSLAQPFALTLTRDVSRCDPIPAFPALSNLPPLGSDSRETLILADLGRLQTANPAAFRAKLDALAASPAVNGVVVDLNSIPRIVAANANADRDLDCPYAKNVVAREIKAVVDAARSANPTRLKNLVIVGGDDVVAFSRVPDLAELANENTFFPPVRDNTALQASLRLGYFLSDDPYSAKYSLGAQSSDVPILDLRVGRLVETEAEIARVIDAFLCLGTPACPGTLPGQVATPGSAFISGYDFLSDAADTVDGVLRAGLTLPGGAAPRVSRVVAPADCLPADRRSPDCSWSGDRLRTQLLGGQRHDLVFLAGHFSPQSALAADYETRVTTQDLLSSNTDFTNAIVFSAGCHSGFSLSDGAVRPEAPRQPDWAQAFAARGATTFMGTGYQYGDTDFVEYSERLYLEFARALRARDGAVSVGEAALAAKQALRFNTGAESVELTNKATMIATLFGLPMLKIDMPGPALPSGDGRPIVSALQGFGAGPGAAANLNLRYADVELGAAAGAPLATPAPPVTLTNLNNRGQTQDAIYYTGRDGVTLGAGTPVLPRTVFNVNPPFGGPPAQAPVLRGVGFRGGSYSDVALWPLTAAPASELSRVRPIFTSDVFFPTDQTSVNYFDQLADDGAGVTRLSLSAAQYRSDGPTAPTGTLRVYRSYDVRLYYSDNVRSYSAGAGTASPLTNTPALAAPLSIDQIGATSAQGAAPVRFQARVTGDLSAGVQEVWVTFTDPTAPARQWRSLNLAQDRQNSTLWAGALSAADLQQLGMGAANLRYLVQAVNGVGLVTLMTNEGAYYRVDAPATQPPGAQIGTALAVSGPASGVFGGSASFSVSLRTAQGAPLGGQPVTVVLGSQSRRALTDANGAGAVSFALTDQPAPYTVAATFDGSAVFSPSSATTAFFGPSGATAAFAITAQATQLTLSPNPATAVAGAGETVVASVSAAGKPLFNAPVRFVVTAAGASATLIETTVATGFNGRAALGPLSLPPGSYSVAATAAEGLIGYTSSRATAALTLQSATAPPELTLADVPPPPTPDLGATGVTLRGTINPRGGATTWVFRIRQDGTAYGQIADRPAPAGSLGASTAPQPVSAAFAGLRPGTLYRYKLVARNAAGTVETAEKAFRTPYAFSGFFQPVDNLPTVNVVTAGRAIPVKFSLGGAYGLDILGGAPVVQEIACPAGAPVDNIEETVTAGSSSLTYSPGSGQYTYIWATQRAWAGTCRQLQLRLNDGSVYRANFQFRR